MTSQTLHRRNFLLHLQERPAYNEPVLLKEPAHEQLASAQIAQLHNEHVITRQLVDVPGVRPVCDLEGSESHPVLLLKYIEGQSLTEIIQEKSLELPDNAAGAVLLLEHLWGVDMRNAVHAGGGSVLDSAYISPQTHAKFVVEMEQMEAEHTLGSGKTKGEVASKIKGKTKGEGSR